MWAHHHLIHYCSNFQQQLLNWCLPKVVITIKWKRIRNFDLNPQQQRATTFCVTNPFQLLELVETVNSLIFKSVCCQCSDNEVSWVKTLQLKKTLWPLFLWMGLNCLKATATSSWQFIFHHSVPRNSWYSFYRPWKDERLSWAWSHQLESGVSQFKSHYMLSWA